jgi:hypothetical protein
MADFHMRSDSVDVEQIMRQIRARIRDKRGADYTEAELEQLATVKLERFLDPRGVRSDLVEQFRRRRVVPEAPPNYEFGEATLYETHRGALRRLRGLFKPLLKLFFNPDKITTALHIQSQVNTQAERRLRFLEEREPLYYELIHNLVLEVTRLGIEVHNLKMRVESLSSRLDFDERRARALEGVVQYKPAPPPGRGGVPPRNAPPPVASSAPVAAAAQAPNGGATPPSGEARPDSGSSGERRRRRRRRRRRPGQTLAESPARTDAPPRAPGGSPGGSAPATGFAPAAAPADDDSAGHDDWADDDDDSPGPERGAPDQ